MKKLLNNPIVVLILVAVSLFYMYWNVLRPMLGWDQSNQVQASQEDSHNSSDETGDSNDETQEANTVLTFDSSAVNHFKPSWSFSYSRDPFKKERRRKYARTVHIDPKLSPTKRKKYRPYKRNSRYSNNMDAIQAISVGPGGSLALIQGQTVELKHSPSIASDTVLIQLNNQTKNFIFKPKTSQ